MTVSELGYSQASAPIKSLEVDGTLIEATGRKRNKMYIAPAIMGEDYTFRVVAPLTPKA